MTFVAAFVVSRHSGHQRLIVIAEPCDEPVGGPTSQNGGLLPVMGDEDTSILAL